VFAACLVGSNAAAQVRWDASGSVGPSGRFLVSRGPGSDDAGVGGRLELKGHVAVMPFLRLGAGTYAELSPQGDAGARRMFGVGLRAKILLPLSVQRFRFFMGTGANYVGVMAPSFETELFAASGTGVLGGPAIKQKVEIAEAGGSFFEIPLLFATTYKVTPELQLLGELGGSVGFLSSGSYYDENGRAFRTELGAINTVAPAGYDRFALFLSVGIVYEPPLL
jgi:hypothetical protein